jgi:hypothetical protein
MSGLQVSVLRNTDGSYRAKFHRHDSYDCAGRRMHEEKHPDLDDYVIVDISALSPRHKACQFECCFPGLPNVEAVIGRHRPFMLAPAQAQSAVVPPPYPGLRIGQTVTVRDLASHETRRWKIVAADAEKPAGAITAQAPIARALLGHDVGDRVTVELPRGTRELLIEQIQHSSP